MSYKSYIKDVKAVLKANKREFAERVGVLCVAESQNLAPVLSGNLKGAITHEVMPGDKGVYVGVGAEAPYGLYVEKGIGQPAQPYLEPGCNNAVPKIKNVAEDIYRRLG